MPEPAWWQTAVVYQIYPRSFQDTPTSTWLDGGKAYRENYPLALADTDGDGVGDLEGVRRRLDHVASLGVDAIWLSPFYRSPMADFGYDVSDYCDVDPLFGTLADFDRLIAEAHQRGLRVIVDWVPNHSSDQHPWFVESRSSRDSAKRDWYVWRDGSPDEPPNNWLAAFGGRAWTWDEATAQWYLHLFLPEQPDLNWANPEVEAAMQDTLRFWLDRGVDGFRVDVVHALGKDPDDLPDWKPGENPSRDLPDPPYGHAILRRLRTLVDSYPGDRMMVGEVYLMSTPRVARYYGEHHDELHLSFNFPPLYAPWDAVKWQRRIERVVEAIEPAGWPTWVLSNHDNPRHRTRYGSEARARAAAVLLLGLRGTPFLYAGEELGLEDAVVPKGREVDPGGRDGCRAPIPWDGSPTHGWVTASPWLPWPPDPGTRNAEALAADDRSILHLYRRLLAIRRTSPALRHGSFDWLPTPDGVLAWLRRADGDRRVVIVNFTTDPHDVAVDGSWSTEVTSDGAPFAGRIGPDQAVILRTRD